MGWKLVPRKTDGPCERSHRRQSEEEMLCLPPPPTFQSHNSCRLVVTPNPASLSGQTQLGASSQAAFWGKEQGRDSKNGLADPQTQDSTPLSPRRSQPWAPTFPDLGRDGPLGKKSCQQQVSVRNGDLVPRHSRTTGGRVKWHSHAGRTV